MGEASPVSRTAFFKRPPPPPAPLPPGPSAVPSPAASAPTLRRPSFHGSGGTLLGIHVVNVLLSLVTLGVYYFWAKTRVRRYLFSQTQFEADRFAYHGTAKELLLGFLKAFVVFLFPIIVLLGVRDWPGVDANIKGVAASLASILFFIFTPVAVVGSRRYRLSRTSWRGIRFSFRGNAWHFIRIFINGSF